jgi:hypothetical protein
VPHDQIAELHRHADIYVSLNPMGNLTNANLEALRLGACMVIPAAQPQSGIDADTARLIPEDAALRVASADDAEGLTAALLHLHRAPDERRRRSARSKAVATELIPSWDERIAWEIALLDRLARGATGGISAPLHAAGH